MTSESGLVWSMNWLSCDEPKNSRTAAAAGLALIEILRHDRVDLDRGHALADGALHAEQADAVLVLHQLAHRAHPAVAEVVDVVDLAAAVAQVHQRLDAGDDVLVAERAEGVRRVEVEAHVHLHPADGREVVALRIEEQRVEHDVGGLDRRRLARAHDAVDVHERLVAVHVLVDLHRVADVGAHGDVIDVEGRDLGDAVVEQHLERAAGHVAGLGVDVPGQLVAGLGPDQAGLLVDDVAGGEAADDGVEGHQHLGDVALVLPLLDHARGDLLVGLGDDLAGLGVDQVEVRLRPRSRSGKKRVAQPLPSLR